LIKEKLNSAASENFQKLLKESLKVIKINIEKRKTNNGNLR